MYRRSVHRGVHRGIIALALVTVLTVAGAQPAAAATNQGILGRVAGLWSAVMGGESNSFWNRLTGWLEGDEAVQSSGAPTKRGGGIDPNGRTEPTGPELTTPSLTNSNG